MSIKFHNPKSSSASGLKPQSRDVLQALWLGARQTCPSCKTGRLYEKYLKVADHCPSCGEALHHHRADDAPPYFTIFVVGHIVLAGVLAMEQALRPSPWLHVAVWIPLTLILSLWMLPRIKGALVALQWALRMHGFEEGVAGAPSDLPTAAAGRVDPRS